MSNFEGYRDRKQFQTLYSVPSSAMRNGNFSELLNNLGPVNPQTGQPAGILVDPTQCTVAGTSWSARPSRGTSFPPDGSTQRRVSCSSSTPSPTAAPVHSQQLPRAAGSRHRQVPVHPADGYGAGVRVHVDGPLQLREGQRGDTGIEAERHQARRPRASGHGRQHLDVESTLLNEFRFGFNYFFNTFGRELANERDVVKELGIPGISLNPPEAWGIPSSALRGSAASATAPKGHTRSTTARSSSATTCRGSRGGTRSRWVAASATTLQPDGQPVRPRQLPVPEHRHRLWVRRFHAGLRAADRIRGGAGGDEVPRPEPGVYLTDTWRLTSNQTLDLGLVTSTSRHRWTRTGR